MSTAFQVETVLDLKIAPALTGLGEYVKALRLVMDAEAAVAGAMRGIVDVTNQAAGAAGRYATNMERAARAAQAAATAAASIPMPPVSPARMVSAGVPPTPATSPLGVPSGAAQASPALAPPQTGFTMQGAPYDPRGTSLVPTGAGRTNTETTGRASPEYGGLTPFGPAGGDLTGRYGFTNENGVNVPWGALPPGPPRPRVPPPSAHEALMAGMILRGAGKETLGAVGDIFDAGAEAGDLEAKMRVTAGFDEPRVQQSMKLAREMVAKVPGLYYKQALELILQTASFTGNVDEALALTPGLARDAQVLAQYSHQDAIKQIENAAKAGELTGLTLPDGKINLPKLTEFVDRLTALDMSSAGTMDMGKYLTSIRQFGVGADAASMDFLTSVLPAYQKIMGEAKSGTAFSSLMQSLSSTKPNTQNKSYLQEQKRLGLRGADNEVNHGDLLRTNPDAWFNQVLMPALAADKKLTATQIQEELYKIFPRQTMVRVGAASIFDQSLIEKEANRNRQQQALGAAPMDTLLSTNALNQVRALAANVDLFKVTMADPNMGNAIGMLHLLTGAISGLTQAAANHPAIAQATVIGASTAGGLFTIAGTSLVLGAFAKQLYGIAKWIAPVIPDGIGTAAGTALRFAAAPVAVGAATYQALDYIGGPKDSISGFIDRYVPGAYWLDYNVNKLFYGSGNDAKDRADFNAARGLASDRADIADDKLAQKIAAALKDSPIKVTVNVDGKKVAESTTRHQADMADRPMTGRGSFDPRMSYTPTEH